MIDWVDGHLDLAYLAVAGRDLTSPTRDADAACITLPALRTANVNLVFATIFTEPGEEHAPFGYRSSEDRDAAESAGLRQLESYEALEQAGELSIVRSASDLTARRPLPRVVLLMEGADPIRTPDDLSTWCDRGLRAVGLTWAMGTRYAGGNGKPGSLSEEGVELVRAMDAHMLIHDVSHLADEALDQLLELSNRPVVATHSNCRTLMGSGERHLRDETISEIGRRDGVVGINLFSKFIVRDRRALLDDVIMHIEHVSATMGHRHGVALGSDADGGFPPTELPAGLDHPTKWGAIATGLKSRGWSEDDVAGFTHRNWLRFLERSLASGRSPNTQ